MPTLYDIKPAFQQLLRPIVRRWAAAGITANQVTIAAAVLSAVGGAGVALGRDHPAALLPVPIVLFVRMALNAIDGMLAREHGQKSALGAILNEIGDVAADAALYLPFALWSGISGFLVVAVVLLGVISEMTGVVAVQIGSARRYDGPMGKSDRAFLFGAIGLLVGCGVPLGWWTNALFVAAALLLALTIWNRARCALRQVGST